MGTTLPACGACGAEWAGMKVWLLSFRHPWGDWGPHHAEAVQGGMEGTVRALGCIWFWPPWPDWVEKGLLGEI